MVSFHEEHIQTVWVSGVHISMVSAATNDDYPATNSSGDTQGKRLSLLQVLAEPQL